MNYTKSKNEVVRLLDAYRSDGQYSYYKNESLDKVSHLVQSISTCDELSENEKINMLKHISYLFGCSMGYELNRSLYNIILMEKHGVIKMPVRAKLSSYQNLIRNGFAYRTRETLVLPSVGGMVDLKVGVDFLVLTPLGLDYKESLLKKGNNYIQKQKEIFAKMGL